MVRIFEVLAVEMNRKTLLSWSRIVLSAACSFAVFSNSSNLSNSVDFTCGFVQQNMSSRTSIREV